MRNDVSTKLALATPAPIATTTFLALIIEQLIHNFPPTTTLEEDRPANCSTQIHTRSYHAVVIVIANKLKTTYAALVLYNFKNC